MRTTAILLGALLAAPLASHAQEQAEGMSPAALEMLKPFPATTSVAAARAHFIQGLRDSDMGRYLEAGSHFRAAIEADPAFAQAHLHGALNAPSLGAFKAGLDEAKKHASHASQAEQLLISYYHQGFVNDQDAQLATANELVALMPKHPRALVLLAGIQGTRGDHAAARATLEQAIALAPTFAPAYMALGNSYMFSTPKDYAKAQQAMKKLVEIEPNESISHDLLADTYRAQNQLAKARDSYTRSAELAPKDRLPLEQRGHANTFLGDYAAARADYEASYALGKANEQALSARWKALTWVHAGQGEKGIAELQAIINQVDGMGIPEPTGVKIALLGDIAQIAIHHGKFLVAEAALQRRAALMMKQADAMGTPEFRHSQQAGIAFMQAIYSAKKKDVPAAQKAIEEYKAHIAEEKNPRKMEAVHELMGYLSLQEGKAGEAVTHYRQADQDDPYVKYNLALALQGSGQAKEAKQLFKEVGEYTFNATSVALIRSDARKKAGM